MVLKEIQIVLNPSEESYRKIYNNHNLKDSFLAQIYWIFNYLICYYVFLKAIAQLEK